MISRTHIILIIMIQFFGVNKRVEEDKRKVISLLVDRIFIIKRIKKC